MDVLSRTRFQIYAITKVGGYRLDLGSWCAYSGTLDLASAFGMMNSTYFTVMACEIAYVDADISDSFCLLPMAVSRKYLLFSLTQTPRIWHIYIPDSMTHTSLCLFKKKVNVRLAVSNYVEYLYFEYKPGSRLERSKHEDDTASYSKLCAVQY